jgi:hypothetical protein
MKAERPPLLEVISRADDFGVSPETNEAILAAVAGGVIRNVGVMAPAPALEHRIEELRRLGEDRICIGLHATLTSEWETLRWGPLRKSTEAGAPVLADGSFPRDTKILSEIACPEAMLAEIQAQLTRIRELGLRPRYLDSHMNFTWIGDVSDRLADLCAGEGLVYANAGGYRRMDLRLDAENLPPESAFCDRAAALSSESAAAGPAVWVFHPSRHGETPTPFPENVAKQRHQEYLHLSRNAAEILRRAGAAGWRFRGYVDDSP